MISKEEANAVRVQIWENLRKVAKPDSRFSFDFAEFITDYEGSEDGARRLVQQPFYRKADVVFVTPDNNLEYLRQLILEDRKTLVMTNYSISRGFFLIEPGAVPEGKEELASTLDGVARFWKHQTLAQLRESVGHIDLLVTGGSAINLRGIRFGKGHGYFDLEWAMLYSNGLVDDRSVIAAACHDCQVVDVDTDVQPYDTAIDYIVTPTRVIESTHQYPRPKDGIYWSLLDGDMLGRIPPLQECWWAVNCK